MLSTTLKLSSRIQRGAACIAAGVASLLMAVAPANADLLDGLTFYLDADGNIEDKAGDLGSTANTVDDDGAPVGTAGSVDFGPGIFGQAGIFDGEDGYVAIPTSPDLEAAGESISISAWFRVDTFDTNWQALIAKGEGSRYRIARSGSSNMMAYAGGTGDITGGPDVTDGLWHHVVAITNNGGTTEMWIDGDLAVEGAGPATLDDEGSDLFIGNNPQALGREWEGGIDDIAIWNRSLSGNEIRAIYNGGVLGSSLGNVIPEPSSVALLLSGITMLFGWNVIRRRSV